MGGKRLNAGRKKSEHKTKVIAFRVRIEFIEPIKLVVKNKVLELLQKK